MNRWVPVLRDRGRDFFIVQGVILFLAVGYILSNLVVDIVYSYLDPRIRLS